MTVEILTESLGVPPVAAQRTECVERKGLGHPDSICDAVMEAISVRLSDMYVQRTGQVQHHNLDKGLLVAGQTVPAFGGGRVDRPMRLVIGDRAGCAVRSADRWISRGTLPRNWHYVAVCRSAMCGHWSKIFFAVNSPTSVTSLVVWFVANYPCAE